MYNETRGLVNKAVRGSQMERLVELQVNEAPEHSVLPYAKEYDVRAIHFDWPEIGSTATLELEASSHEDYAVLRFEGVEDVCIPCGGLMTEICLKIQDTSQCPSKSHYIPPVRVGGTSSNGCSLKFWAQSVKRINKASKNV